MPKPEAAQLEAQAKAPVSGLKAHPLGASACLVAGIAVVVAMALLLGQDSLHSVDLRFVIPISSISIILSIAALVRREPGFTLPAIAIALAGSALILGWIVVVGLVALGTAIVIGILSYLL